VRQATLLRPLSYDADGHEAPDSSPVARRRIVFYDGDRPSEGRIREAFPDDFWALSWRLAPDHRCTGADYVVVDICPDGRARVDLVAEVMKRYSPAGVYAVTAYPSLAVAVAAIKAGAKDCLAKPLDPFELLAAIDGSPTRSEACPRTLPSLARVQWDYMARVLESVQGNISQAARTLGIQRSTLQRKLKKYPPRW
jgi:two-component system response regulator RegA